MEWSIISIFLQLQPYAPPTVSSSARHRAKLARQFSVTAAGSAKRFAAIKQTFRQPTIENEYSKPRSEKMDDTKANTVVDGEEDSDVVTTTSNRSRGADDHNPVVVCDDNNDDQKQYQYEMKMLREAVVRQSRILTSDPDVMSTDKDALETQKDTTSDNHNAGNQINVGTTSTVTTTDRTNTMLPDTTSGGEKILPNGEILREDGDIVVPPPQQDRQGRNQDQQNDDLVSEDEYVVSLNDYDSNDTISLAMMTNVTDDDNRSGVTAPTSTYRTSTSSRNSGSAQRHSASSQVGAFAIDSGRHSETRRSTSSFPNNDELRRRIIDEAQAQIQLEQQLGRIGPSAIEQPTSITITDENMDVHHGSDVPVAAEVAPDIMDLEQSIAQRVKQEQARNTPVAQVIDPKLRRRRIVLSSVCGLIVLVGMIVGIVLGVGKPDADNSKQEPTGNDALPPNSTIISLVPKLICYERVPGTGWSEYCGTNETIRGGGVNNLVAISRLWNIPEADISLLNAAEVRTDIAGGTFDIRMAKELLPFMEDSLTLVNITGSRLITAMERGLQKIFDDNELEESSKSMGSYPYTAGLRFSVNMTSAPYERIYDIEVNPGLNSTWQPFNMTHTYTIVTNSYLANGGDSYHELSYGNEDLEHLPALAAFVDYCQDHLLAQDRLLADPSSDLYSTKTYTHASQLILPTREAD